jgi:hypothetical protein
MSRRREKSLPMSGFVKKSAMLSVVDTKGTRSESCPSLLCSAHWRLTVRAVDIRADVSGGGYRANVI